MKNKTNGKKLKGKKQKLDALAWFEPLNHSRIAKSAAEELQHNCRGITA